MLQQLCQQEQRSSHPPLGAVAQVSALTERTRIDSVVATERMVDTYLKKLNW